MPGRSKEGQGSGLPKNPVATGSGVTLLVEAGHLIMESRPVLPPRAYRTSTCRRSGRQRSEDTRTRSAEAERSEVYPTWHNSTTR